MKKKGYLNRLKTAGCSATRFSTFSWTVFICLMVLFRSVCGEVALDPVFNSGAGTGGPSADYAYAEHVLVLPDDKVLVCGIFTTYNGQNAPYIIRLNEDGTLDPTFKTGAVNFWIRHMAVQSDGKIVIGGAFWSVGGISRNLIARLNADGSLDPSFDPGLGFEEKVVPPDPNPPYVFWLALQPDGKILVTGSFGKFNGQPAAGIVRLNPDGSRDTTFNIGNGFDSWGRSIWVQPNGQIMATGWFVNYNGFACNRMVLINPDGSADPSFHPFFGDKTSIYSTFLLPNGQRIVSGHTKNENGLFSRKIARLNPDGSEDSSFLANTDNRTEFVLPQPDGKILASGWFTSADNTPRLRLARFNADGTLDLNFSADFSDFIWTMAFDSKGRLLTAGGFDHVNGVARRGVARLLLDVPESGGGSAPALKSDSKTSTTVTLDWTDDSARVGYGIEKKNGTDFLEVGSVSSSTHTFTVANLSPNTAYAFRIQARNADGSSVYSDEVTNTTTVLPQANPMAVTVLEGQHVSLTLAGAAAPGANTNYTIVTQPTKGQISGSAPNLIYTATAGFTGPDSFTFVVSDGSSQSAPATVTIQIAPVNHTPVASPLNVSVVAGTPVPIALTGTDSDGDSLTYQIVGAPLHGQVSGGSTSFIYTPSVGFTGTDSFSYVAKDALTQSAPALVMVSIAAPNHPPTANALNYTGVQDAAVSIVLAGGDVDQDSLDFRIISQPVHGQLSGTAPDLTYTPISGFSGNDSFLYIASDGSSQSAPTTVNISIANANTPANHAPTASDLSFQVLGGTPLTLTLGGNDVDHDSLTFFIISPPTIGQLFGTALPALTYVSSADASGIDQFTYIVSDGQAESAPATVRIELLQPNHPPAANTLSVTAEEGTPVAITLSGTDADGDALTFQIITPPTSGQLTGIPPDMIYTPNDLVIGADSFTYVAMDKTGRSSPATVTIKVTRLNHPPSASTLYVNGFNDQPISITLAGEDTDIDQLTFKIVDPPVKGELSGAMPALTYTPIAGATGTDSFTYIADDGLAQSMPATVVIQLAQHQPARIDLGALQGGMILLKVSGPPKSRFQILNSSDSIGWNVISEGTSDENGQAEPALPQGSAQVQLYRAVWP